MSVASFKIGRKEYVVVPRKRYEQLTRAEQDMLDARIAEKANAAYRAGKLKTIPLETARRRWGV